MAELKYKDYVGSIDVSVEDRCFHGRVLFVDDIITYEGNNYDEIESAFKNAVDQYVEYCEKTGKPANKPYSGSFNIRVGQIRHKGLAIKAHKTGISINEVVCKAIDKALATDVVLKHEVTVNHVIHSSSEAQVNVDYSTDETQTWQKPKLTLVH